MAAQKEKKPAAAKATKAPKATTKKAAAKAPKPAAAKAATPPAGAGVIGRVLKVTKPLVKGDDVKAVQNALIALKFHCGADGANGIYGATTAQAVRHFQSMNRLIVSGRVEKFTAQALGFTWQEDGQPPAPPTTPPAGQQPGEEGTGNTPPAAPDAGEGAGQQPAADNPEGQQAGQETPPTQE